MYFCSKISTFLIHHSFMSLTFLLEYRTIYGEDLFLNIIEPDGSFTPHAMHTTDGITWMCWLETEGDLHYFYNVHWQGRVKRAEGWTTTLYHTFNFNTCPKDGIIRDAWLDTPAHFKIAGTLVPVFSLRSHKSFGIGDFGDLKKMIDWVAATGQHLLQILPINDTSCHLTWEDSYPYSCVSVFALHPIYIDLQALPALKKKKDREHFEALRQELNAQSAVDYDRVIQTKSAYLHLLYLQEGQHVVTSTAFSNFIKDEASWLDFYAENSVFSTKLGWTAEEIKVVQFWLSQQLKTVHQHAQQCGVLLKGDIPIGVAREGCDVAQYPSLFNRNGQAGAPPDYFSADGQNWGFPTYNWPEMLKDGCAWWKHRFQKMAQYFDAYRIDHVLGFFRIWEIPYPAKSGIMGQFQPALPYSREELQERGLEAYINTLFLADHLNPNRYHPRINAYQLTTYQELPLEKKQAFDALHEEFFFHRNNQYWYDLAMQKLPALKDATRMICCAEDLGMVPECVGWVLRELGILSLELESMPKEPWVRFGTLEKNPRMSVATISSHDTPTLRMWWDEDEDRAQDYFNNLLHHEGTAPHPLPGALAAEIIQRHMQCPSVFTVISLQDWLAIDETIRLQDAKAERVNDPGNPHHYWRYRMHLTLEELLENDAFNAKIKVLSAR